MNRSLRRQLLGPLVWVWLLGALVAAYGAYHLARYAGDTAYDRTLQDEAGAIATQINWTDRGPLLELSSQAQQILARDSADRNAFMVIDGEGRILAGVGDLPMPRFSDASFRDPVLFDADYQKEPVRGAMYSIRSPMLDQFVSIVVVETKRKRSQLVREIQLGVLLPMLGLGLVTFALLGLSIRRGLVSLQRVAAEVGGRDAHDLRPLPLAGVPTEAVPLIERINALLGNVSRSVELQRRFVADAAHQLRTPVAGIRVLSQELQQELGATTGSTRDEAAAQALLKALVDSTGRMGHLISQLLNLARSEAVLGPGAAGQCERVDVLPVIRAAAEPLVPRVASQGRHISLDAPDLGCLARAHPVWLAEVMSNLLDNAIRYGGSTIEVCVRESGQEVQIEVTDNGAGIPAHHQSLIFEPFWRGERADMHGNEGAGLGLAIVKEIVQRMGGRIEVSSRPQVAGTRFTIALPA